MYVTSWYSDGNLGECGATVAILVSLLVQAKVTSSTGFSGVIVAFRYSVCQGVVSVIEDLSKVTQEICCGASPK